MISISLRNVESEFAKLKKEISKEADKRLPKIAGDIVKELVEATPVDTGKAKNSWTVEKNVISNTVPYIENLNEGSSKQAPAHFIEAICLKHGKPVGPIVTVYPDA